LRVVIDTNLIVNSIISNTGAAAEIMRRWQDRQFHVLVSAPILAEYRRALAYTRVRERHKRNDAALDTLVGNLAHRAIVVEPREALAAVAADPDDDKFLECGVAGQADYLVTRDNHLLTIGKFRGITILAPADFLALLRLGDPSLTSGDETE
jgi:putative PIN family toxin of toxin-antitoxin system